MCIDSSANRGGERSMQEGLEREGIPSFFDRNLQDILPKLQNILKNAVLVRYVT